MKLYEVVLLKLMAGSIRPSIGQWSPLGDV
jgi:hypothetical protein